LDESSAGLIFFAAPRPSDSGWIEHFVLSLANWLGRLAGENAAISFQFGSGVTLFRRRSTSFSLEVHRALREMLEML
jgi:hypothetical protein